MPLIVQDPANPTEEANSYVDLADARAIAESMAVELPADDAEAEKAIIKGTQYINSFEPRVDGKRKSPTQSTLYPRTDTTQNCEPIAEDIIPYSIKKACIVAAGFYGVGTDMFGGVDTGQSIAREKVADLEVAYFDNGSTSSSISSGEIESLMGQFMCNSFGSNNFLVSRY